jgi:hypothetical protein
VVLLDQLGDFVDAGLGNIGHHQQAAFFNGVFEFLQSCTWSGNTNHPRNPGTDTGTGETDTEDSATSQCQAASCDGRNASQDAGGTADGKSTFHGGDKITLLQQTGLRQIRLGQCMVIGSGNVDVAFLDARQQQFIDNGLRAIDSG